MTADFLPPAPSAGSGRRVFKAIYQAPAVLYPVARSRMLAFFLAVGSAAGLCALLAWSSMGSVGRPVLVSTLSLWLVCCTVAWRFWQKSPTGTLTWDGRAWFFDHHAQAYAGTAMAVHLDLQRHLWLCLRPENGPILWLWLEQHHAPLLWADVRRAVYSRPRPDPVDTHADTHDSSFSG